MKNAQAVEFLKELDKKLIEINWNKKPINMSMFLSFLTVSVVRSTSHLGSSNGWTRFEGENNLEIGGGVVSGVEYLNSIKFGRKLDNPYNDYVNPFYLFEILSDEGKSFFVDYYKAEIESVRQKAEKEAQLLEAKLKKITDKNTERLLHWESVFKATGQHQ